jgi:tetratricopeptide (TPR) repeat protein
MNNLMRRAKYIFCMFLMVHAISLAGQSRSDLRSMFVSAEGDILFEDYAEALPKYLSLLQIFPDNYNLYYRVGQCYLNTPGEKEKSIEWLETAVKNIDPDYRTGRLSEKGVPRDALYHLANAYRIASNFDMALETYELFLKDADTEKYDTTLVRFQMQSCHNAREMMLKPADVEERNLGVPVNDRFSEFNPVVSADESTLLFTRELPFYDAIFWSRKVDGNWTEPVNMTPQLGVDQDYYTSSLSPDGRTLLMYRIDTYDGNIYMSRLVDDTWSQVEKLNGNINTKFWESHATMSSDGKRIFFTSNRRESLGGLDIFVSARDSSGNWGPAANLGHQINTVYNEETPFLTNNDSTLFFSSRGHYNIGGYDIFRSDLDRNGRWSTPVNVGYPLNTTDDDLFFAPLSSGIRGYFGKFADDGQGRMDIYSCDIYSELNPRNVTVEETGTQPVKPDEPAAEILTVDTLAFPADSLTSVTRPVPADSLTASVQLPVNPDETVPISNELYDSTDTLTLADSFISDTRENVEEDPADLTARDVNPLYKEIPVRPAGENEQGSIADEAPDKPAAGVAPEAPDKPAASEAPEPTGAADKSVATDAAEPIDATATAEEAGLVAADTNGSKGDNPPGADCGKGCCLWWLLALTALLFFFIIWRRRKKKKEDDVEQ